jgi:general secretion pathway protein G
MSITIKGRNRLSQNKLCQVARSLRSGISTGAGGQAAVSRGGFSIIELVVIIIVLGILAGVGIPKIGSLIKSGKVNETKAEMAEIRKAIIGDPQLMAGGVYTARGYAGDVGHLPSRLQDLVIKPDSVSTWNRVLNTGWHGPYIDTNDGSYLADAWGAPYVYDPNGRTLTSTGSGSSIVISF